MEEEIVVVYMLQDVWLHVLDVPVAALVLRYPLHTHSFHCLSAFSLVSVVVDNFPTGGDARLAAHDAAGPHRRRRLPARAAQAAALQGAVQSK